MTGDAVTDPNQKHATPEMARIIDKVFVIFL
jgi:hypothetical protein